MDSAQLDIEDRHRAEQETAYTYHEWEQELDEGIFDET